MDSTESYVKDLRHYVIDIASSGRILNVAQNATGKPLHPDLVNAQEMALFESACVSLVTTRVEGE